MVGAGCLYPFSRTGLGRQECDMNYHIRRVKLPNRNETLSRVLCLIGFLKPHRLNPGVQSCCLSSCHKLLRRDIRPLNVGPDLMHLVCKEADLPGAPLHIPTQRSAVSASPQSYVLSVSYAVSEMWLQESRVPETKETCGNAVDIPSHVLGSRVSRRKWVWFDRIGCLSLWGGFSSREPRKTS